MLIDNLSMTLMADGQFPGITICLIGSRIPDFIRRSRDSRPPPPALKNI